jgi:pimeloyl-ACP methyl ester carboxylesterase
VYTKLGINPQRFSTTVWAVTSIDGPVMLVGHSYGGSVISNAAKGGACR